MYRSVKDDRYFSAFVFGAEQLSQHLGGLAHAVGHLADGPFRDGGAQLAYVVAESGLGPAAGCRAFAEASGDGGVAHGLSGGQSRGEHFIGVSRAPVSLRALIQRINRKLAADGEKLKTMRGERWRPHHLSVEAGATPQVEALPAASRLRVPG